MKPFKSIVEKLKEEQNKKKHIPNAFCILKPGFVDEYEHDFDNLLQHYGWQIIDKQRRKLTADQADQLYINLEKEPYYHTLCDYMSSQDCICYSCHGDFTDPIKEMCDLKKLVREMWQEDEMKNAMHCSDSLDNVVRECNICMSEDCTEAVCSVHSTVEDNNVSIIKENNKTYDDIINALNEAKNDGTPVEEGLFKALVGGVAGMTIAPAIMKALCSVLGVDVKGQFGSILTSRLVLTALCTKMGWDK